MCLLGLRGSPRKHCKPLFFSTDPFFALCWSLWLYCYFFWGGGGGRRRVKGCPEKEMEDPSETSSSKEIFIARCFFFPLFDLSRLSDQTRALFVSRFEHNNMLNTFFQLPWGVP